VREFGSAFGRPRLALSGAAEEAALAHGWPGNVRELRNRVERAVALAEGATIDRADLFPGERGAGVIATLAEARDAAERRQIERALAQTDGRIQAAAALLGVSRTTLWEKMRRLGIDGEG
jgi:transcriptional regulator of acetoin/glycerol metabolism